jgi:nitroimidazol reductase NimA-like FMN-containing flavoprotein (pyridoxamine 5'-phosphate oxidase superfamily)
MVMGDSMKQKILSLLDAHRILTTATLRPDGWPQATTVGHVNEGLTLWFLCGLDSQKARNIAHDNRVSITIDHDTPDIMSITGLSMAARAHRVSDRAEAEKVIAMLPLKYPDAPPAMAQMKMPAPEEIALSRRSGNRFRARLHERICAHRPRDLLRSRAQLAVLARAVETFSGGSPFSVGAT